MPLLSFLVGPDNDSIQEAPSGPDLAAAAASGGGGGAAAAAVQNSHCVPCYSCHPLGNHLHRVRLGRTWMCSSAA
jgi:hypothetical protein